MPDGSVQSPEQLLQKENPYLRLEKALGGIQDLKTRGQLTESLKTRINELDNVPGDKTGGFDLITIPIRLPADPENMVLEKDRKYDDQDAVAALKSLDLLPGGFYGDTIGKTIHHSLNDLPIKYVHHPWGDVDLKPNNNPGRNLVKGITGRVLYVKYGEHSRLPHSAVVTVTREALARLKEGLDRTKLPDAAQPVASQKRGWGPFRRSV